MDFLNESGLVNRFSSLFSRENIPILYITTLKSNFILYDVMFTEKVKEMMKKHDL